MKKPRATAGRSDGVEASRGQSQNAAMKATHDETTFTLTGTYWSATYPLEELPKWLAFYRRQKERFPKAGNSYDETVASLEALAKELRITAPSD